MKVPELATAAAIVFVAAVVMIDSFPKSGWTPTGPDAGFYPFWSGAVMAVAGLVVAEQALRGRGLAIAFAGRENLVALAQVVLPMAVAVSLLGFLGIYVVSAAYLAYFGRWVGRHRWIVVLPVAVLVPLVTFFVFETAFKVSLPKTWLYYQGLLPF